MKRFEQPILVTRPYLPDLEEYKQGLSEIWKNQWLTNNGPMVQKFQAELSEYLGVPETNMALFVNGTLALELGYKAMGLFGGEVITTPFTFVATSHALRRIGARPVFADIDPETLCLDPAKVEPLIKPGITKAIVPVHVYGHVCDTEAFAALGEKYNIPIIYDAAHAFGVTQGVDIRCSGRKEENLHSTPTPTPYTSIAACGDMSMFSFHPTKLFHSCEGGLLVFKDRLPLPTPTPTPYTSSSTPTPTPYTSSSTPTPTSYTSNSNSLQNRLFELRNFAIHSELECTDVGSNAKMNELQALMGLCCLRKMPELLAYRKSVYDAYAEVFNNPLYTYTSHLHLLPYSANHAYVPVLFNDAATRERVYTDLKEKCNVFSRRYFYPLLTDFAPYAYAKGTCPIAEDIASRVLTLPTYYGLAPEDVKQIAQNVLEIVR